MLVYHLWIVPKLETLSQLLNIWMQYVVREKIPFFFSLFFFLSFILGD